MLLSSVAGQHVLCLNVRERARVCVSIGATLICSHPAVCVIVPALKMFSLDTETHRTEIVTLLTQLFPALQSYTHNFGRSETCRSVSEKPLN